MVNIAFFVPRRPRNFYKSILQRLAALPNIFNKNSRDVSTYRSGKTKRVATTVCKWLELFQAHFKKCARVTIRKGGKVPFARFAYQRRESRANNRLAVLQPKTAPRAVYRALGRAQSRCPVWTEPPLPRKHECQSRALVSPPRNAKSYTGYSRVSTEDGGKRG